jgi:hypothetical protein
MTMDRNKFAKKLIPKTPEDIKKEKLEEEKELKRANQLAEIEAQKATKVLNEDFKNVVGKFFNASNLKTPKQILTVSTPLKEETLIEQIELVDPLVLRDGKIAIDQSKLVDLISKQNSVVIQNTLEKVRQNTVESIATSGGGGIGVRYEDFSGNQTNILKSVSTMIFTGDGVTLDRQGKNIEVNIPGASVVADDPTIDFARESTMLQLYANMQTMLSLVNNLQGLIIPQVYPNGIGGSTSSWTPI